MKIKSKNCLLSSDYLSKKDLLEEKESIQPYFDQYGFDLSVFSFVNLFIWSDFFQYYFEEVAGNLCVFAKDEAGTFLFVPPIGRGFQSEVFQYCFDRMEKENEGSGITRIEYVPWSIASKAKENGYIVSEKPQEYCYKRSELADLKGSLYKSQRHACNQCVKYYSDIKYSSFELSMKEECLCLYDEWAKNKLQKDVSDEFRFMIEDSRSSHKILMEHYDQLNIIGRVVEVNKKIEAYTFGYALNNGMFCVFCEIANANIVGLSNFIFRSYCDDPYLQDYEWINVMDDCGFESLKVVKNLYHPHRKMIPYIIKKKDEK